MLGGRETGEPLAPLQHLQPVQGLVQGEGRAGLRMCAREWVCAGDCVLQANSKAGGECQVDAVWL